MTSLIFLFLLKLFFKSASYIQIVHDDSIMNLIHSNQSYFNDEPKFGKSHSYSLEKDKFREKNIEKTELKSESSIKILLTISIPFFISGFGMVGAGLLFDTCQNWDLYQNIHEIIILVPALLGLNLEITLASRLSTQVNIGKIYNSETIISAVIGNSVLIQLQAIIIGFLVSLLAAIFEYANTQNFVPSHLLILITSSVATASLASFFLATVIMFTIIISNKLNINPDNIATPIASSLGDLVTLAILSAIGTFLYSNKTFIGIPIVIIIFYLLCIPIFIYMSYQNEFVNETLYQGWIPLISAMLIASVAGVILKTSVEIYPIVAIYQPVINGVGGNLVAIFSSRLSTSIHRTTIKGEYPSWRPKSYLSYPYETFFGRNNPERKTAQILMFLILPGQVIFFFKSYFITAVDIKLTLTLVVFYLLIAFVQVIVLLLICYWFVFVVWRFKKNPDNICIPYLTAFGDLLGVAFLLLAMHMVYLTGNESVKSQIAQESLIEFNNKTTNIMQNLTFF